MKRLVAVLPVVAVGVLMALTERGEAVTKCPPDSVRSATICIDKYEASVWKVPATEKPLINKIQKGTVKLGDLTSTNAVAAGVLPLGLAVGDLAAAGCPDTGNGCLDAYAVSIAGVLPARFITWFQAAAAARNSGKRLPTNQEWQISAFGTPDGAPCNVSGGTLATTGSSTLCMSEMGAFDMVGNVWEWVADWVPRTTDPNCESTGSWGSFSDDTQCVLGAATSGAPGALIRGGSTFTVGAGIFAISAFNAPSVSGTIAGFRAAR